MVNPVLTVLFNLFLVGSAIAILAAMLQECLDSRKPSVGGGRSADADARAGRTRPTAPERTGLRRAA